MLSLLAQTKAILREYGLRPSKRLGQSFLIDANILDKILEAAEITPEDIILEIGPGTGVLTEPLLERAGQVIAVEYDKGLYGYLLQRYEGNPKLVLVHGDYLKIDLARLLYPSPPSPLPGGEGSLTLTPGPSPGGRGGLKERKTWKEPRGKLPDYLLELCRKFRKEPTDTEKMLWSCLRNHQLYGLKFRRQYPIGRYIADFYCHEHKLVIEIDGGVHLKKGQQLYDVARQEDLEGQGYRVLRVTTQEVQNNLEGVLNKIVETCFVPVTPLPPGEGCRRRGEGLREVPSPPAPLPGGEGSLKLKVVANLPYYISTPLLFKFLEERGFIDYAVLMLQKEVVARLAARPGTKDYGALTVNAALYSSVAMITPVSRRCFYPAPEVDSALIKLSFRERPAVELKDEALFNQIVRAAFGQRRKTLYNALVGADLRVCPAGEGGHMGPPLQIKQALAAAGIDGRRRGETLSLEEFARLSNALT